jgi:hypothetical protein
VKARGLIAVVFAVLAFGGLGYFAWRFLADRETQFCKVCSRAVHEHSQAVALVDRKQISYCCPACALSEHQQSGQPIEVIELTDYLNGRKLRPADAFAVRNSSVNPCLQHQPLVTADKQPMHSFFDRCSPSILAFASRTDAEGFAREHGGQVLRFADLASEYHH